MKPLAGCLALTVSLGVAGASPAFGSWAVQEENDLFAGTDEHYTQGLRILHLSDEVRSTWLQRRADRLWDRLWKRRPSDPDPRARAGWTLGQNMYTPIRLDSKSQNPRDRPWAGWLWWGLAQQRESACAAADEGCRPRQQTLEIDFGVVGPAAGARSAQVVIHRVYRAYGSETELPQGWHLQLKNEPGVMALYRVKERWPARSTVIDFVPEAAIALGNVLTFAEVGATARVGWNLSGFGADPIPSVGLMAEGDEPTESARPPWEVFVSVGGVLRGVLVNVFLDGNHLRDSHSVEKKPLVVDGSVGAGVRLCRVRVSYTLVRRSSEFDFPLSNHQRFGSILVSWEPRTR